MTLTASLAYSMLETVREYAREKLEALGEADAVRWRLHAAFYAALAQDEWQAWLAGAGTADAGRVTGTGEHPRRPHLRACCEGCCAYWRRSSPGVARFWNDYGLLEEAARSHVPAMAALAGDEPGPAWGSWMYVEASAMARVEGRSADAERFSEEGPGDLQTS